MRIATLVAVTAATLLTWQVVNTKALAQQDSPEVLEGSPPEAVEEGRLVEIGPDRGAGDDGDTNRRQRRQNRRLARPGFVEEPVVVSRYMIGIGGGPLPIEVRAQLDIENDRGVLVRVVDPQGPAAEAGVEPYDVILRANGKPIADLRTLAEIVGEQGELNGRITLELLRRGRPQTVWVVPVERPVQEANNPPRRRFGGEGFGGGGFGNQLFGDEGFGGDMFGGDLAENFAQLLDGLGIQQGEQNYVFGGPEGGVSVNVRRDNQGPAQVTVQRGEETWEFNSDDAEALEMLPEGVRPLVERVLRGGPGVDLNVGPGGLRLQIGELQERMREMQQQTQDLRRQLDEAPPFNPGAAAEENDGPEELEIPAE